MESFRIRDSWDQREKPVALKALETSESWKRLRAGELGQMLF
jgi:hypothetical protein